MYADVWSYETRTHTANTRKCVAFAPPLLDPSSMTEASPRMYVNNARYGCYNIMYPLSATGAMPYMSTLQVTEEANHAQFLWPDDTVDVSSGTIDTPAYAPLRGTQDYNSYGGFQCGFMVFEGLASDATIQLKTKQGLEIVPTNATIAQAFTRSSPMLDREALDVVARVAQTAAGSYPANYNDLSKVLGSVAGAIKGVAGPVAGIADFLSGAHIPVISDIAGVVGDVSKFISGIFG